MRIRFEPMGKESDFNKDITLLEAARQLGIELESICGGRGTCGKCKVFIKEYSKSLPKIFPIEKKTLSPEQLGKGIRLACLFKPKDNVTVEVPLWSSGKAHRLQVEGLPVEVTCKPFVSKFYLELPQATLHDQASDDDRLLKGLKKKIGDKVHTISPYALQKLSKILREGDWRVTVVVWNNSEIVDVETGDTTQRLFGAAVDLGSTKIAYYLVDLKTNRPVNTVSIVNPQREYGEDIMTRMTYANRGRREFINLQKAAVDALNELTKRACRNKRIPRTQIYEMVVVGNTVMHHFLHGFPTKFLSLSPYIQTVRRPITLDAQDLGIQINPAGKIHTLPTIRSFVGADNTAVCLSTKILEKKKPTLILDIGTNTELDCGSKKLGVYATSTPSGPAFEGWATKWGITATEGAIDRISIEPDTFDVSYTTIGGKAPIGICGSGFIDTLAGLMRCGVIGPRPGFISKVDTRRLRKGTRGIEFVLAWKSETGIGEDIVITQNDLNELIKAKAAIHAAMTLLLNHIGIEEEKISELLLAGAFGSYMDAENACTIGLLPELDLNKIMPVGNAAGTGAKMALINRHERVLAEEISQKINFIELATHPHFIKEYVDSMFLPHRDFKRYPRTLEILRDIESYKKDTDNISHSEQVI